MWHDFLDPYVEALVEELPVIAGCTTHFHYSSNGTRKPDPVSSPKSYKLKEGKDWGGKRRLYSAVILRLRSAGPLQVTKSGLVDRQARFWKAWQPNALLCSLHPAW